MDIIGGILEKRQVVCGFDREDEWFWGFVEFANVVDVKVG
jgi:hypothetical protein